MSDGRSRVVRWRGADGGPFAAEGAAERWEGVVPRAYARDGEAAAAAGVVRHTLAGGAVDAEPGFEVRCFEVAPGGWSSCERHAHPHVVVVLAGRGEVLLDDARHSVAPFDLVYVAPWTAHQFRAAEDAPLAFLCVVDRERDRPQRLPAGRLSDG